MCVYVCMVGGGGCDGARSEPPPTPLPHPHGQGTLLYLVKKFWSLLSTLLHQLTLARLIMQTA